MNRLIALTFLFHAVSAAQESESALLKRAQSDLNAGRYASAIKSATAAADSFRASHDQPHLIRALTDLGLAQMYSGDYPVALSTFSNVLDLSRGTHDLEYEITTLNNIGTVQYFTGRYSESMNAYRTAEQRVAAAPPAAWLDSRRQLTSANTAILYQTLGQNDRALAVYHDLLNSHQALSIREEAQVLANVGVLRRRLGDPQKALETYRQAQALYQKAGHRDGEVAVLNNIGILQAIDLHEYRDAAATFTKALDLAQQAGDRPLVLHARLYRGEAYFRDGLLRESAGDYRAAADEASSLGAKEEQWKADFGLARIALREQDTARGIELAKRAVERIESLRAHLDESSLRSLFLADKRDVYDLLIATAPDAKQALEYMEQSRARGLADQLNTAKRRDLLSTLPQDTVLLEYWLGDSSIAIVWGFRSKLGLRRVNLSPDQRRALANLPVVLTSKRQDWMENARPLAQLLLADLPPLQEAKASRLVIVPDGLLATIPFEALPFEGGLLLERFIVSYVPASQLLRSATQGRRIRWFWQNALEAFADPEPSPGASTGLTTSTVLPPLPEARNEVAGIAAELGGHSQLYLGADALKSKLLTKSDAPVLHFATHAFVDLENPDLSYILLAPSSKSQHYDYLFLKEISDLPLANRTLVTLSACQTGIGKDVPGEGVQSFAAKLLASGAPTVITSLWQVSDRATEELMIRFYRYVANGELVAEAMRHAKLDFLHSQPTVHPAYWAAFVVTGDGTARVPYVIRLRWLLVPIALAILWFMVRAGKARQFLDYRRLTGL